MSQFNMKRLCTTKLKSHPPPKKNPHTHTPKNRQKKERKTCKSCLPFCAYQASQWRRCLKHFNRRCKYKILWCSGANTKYTRWGRSMSFVFSMWYCVLSVWIMSLKQRRSVSFEVFYCHRFSLFLKCWRWVTGCLWIQWCR